MNAVIPYRQTVRAAGRKLAKLFGRSGIEAGGGGWRWSGSPTLPAPQQSTLAARGPAKARAAALSVNNPTAARIVETWCAALIGKGWQSQSQHPDRNVARGLNDEFETLVAPLLPQIARAVVRDGEAFLRILNGPEGIRLLQLPADQIDPAMTSDLANGSRIVAGIEFDPTETPVAYHVLPDAPGTPFARYGETMRIPASEILHIFDPLFPGQVRGITWLAPVLLKLADADAASDAMMMNLKTQSLFAAFITDPDGGAAGFTGTEKDGTINLALEPGTTRILPPGADVRFAQPGGGLSQQVEFIKAQLHEIAAGAGLMYEQISTDLSSTNYSSARFGLLEFRRRAEMLQRLLIEGQLLRPLWRRWIDWKALAGDVPSDGASLSDYRAVRFVPPGWQWVDPLKEVNADARAIEAGLKSRAEVVAGRGRDINELDEEIAADRRTARQEGDA
ncbi:phage portal protein [Qingshengfaniella alkalisoli]|uniref:Phage portal protein n=1 Tax=Qingshengfaniella alkalisoli TaxID=2599296 RepID=A0A5B8IA34_9RHOB|nr:phage portal protein [Qingshengfaniella alkalisoli]QDY70016.1 phage portal protein [Qingshengfaniella alkalisoli]